MRQKYLFVGFLLVVLAVPLRAEPPRPLLVTIDDLPIATASLHPDPAERMRLTRQILDVLERHQVPAVGFVIWDAVKTSADQEILEAWLEAGHELGSHSASHPDYSKTEIEPYLEDLERARAGLAAFLEERGQRLRLFRFPYLRQGNTAAKLTAVREYLDSNQQRNLPVTIDTQDWSFNRDWVRAQRAGDQAAMQRLGEAYQASMRLSVRYHERNGDRLFERQTPQVLLLHANAVGAAQWDELFSWLTANGHRFVGADEVLADPALAETHDYVGPRGFSLWDRIADGQRREQARDQVRELLSAQIAAWNRGDLEAFCAVYAEDAAFVSPGGLERGRQQILERYRRRYPDRAAMGTLDLEITEIRTASGVGVSMLGDARPSPIHGASIAARWKLSYPDRDPASGMTLIVLQKFHDRWLIVQDASM